MIQQQDSLLINALDSAMALIQAQQTKTHLPPFLTEKEDKSDRGNLRSFPNSSTKPVTQQLSLTDTEAHLAALNAQITQMQVWLHANPELLRILDQSIHSEIKQMERRTNTTTILINTVFTILGTIVGIVLPSLLTWILHLLGY